MANLQFVCNCSNTTNNISVWLTQYINEYDHYIDGELFWDEELNQGYIERNLCTFQGH